MSSKWSEDRRKKRGRHFRRQNKIKKTPAKVVPILQQQWAPGICLQKNASYWRLCLNRRHHAEEYIVLPLKVWLTVLPQPENNKRNSPHKRICSAAWRRFWIASLKFICFLGDFPIIQVRFFNALIWLTTHGYTVTYLSLLYNRL